nr:uncharacterized protein LOC117996797 [Maniola hyperantus]
MFLYNANLSKLYLIITAIIVVSHALESKTDDEEVQKVLEKYFKKVSDVQSKYVINEGLSKIIARYFNGTVNAFPLFRISIKMDRKPIKIPWTLDQVPQVNDTLMKKKYKYVKVKYVK